MKEKLPAIVKLIDRYDLGTKSRKREKVYQRSYLMNELRNFMSLKTIGDLFNRDHSTVIYCISVAKTYLGMKDRMFADVILEIKSDFEMIMEDKYNFYVRCAEYNEGIASIHFCTFIDRDLIIDLQSNNTMGLLEFKEWVNKLEHHGAGLDKIA